MASSKTYEWKAGRITWGGEQFNAFVISNLTPEEVEENPFSAIVGSRTLAENLGLTESPAKWAGVRKAERHAARVALPWLRVGKKFRATTNARPSRRRGPTTRSDRVTDERPKAATLIGTPTPIPTIDAGKSPESLLSVSVSTLHQTVCWR